ncbi:UxaA family hydrolase [Desulfosporosinus nitroreducens]|uniref:UxaA family hydrolase n=1 Tax=Desulfosporosinus nitroreducens TaxID=2018668 RepID=A0ABT8QN39_9FIRM|nr:UxaA family hydrolase [Desulfosporosinus nitroreducens]MCO1604011.1 UxaA family hydrolase [Desulfosporosinus nitroreducens]MDO0822756.1 UxaA family hydrolase [Desulfosporosinus nitroreducens]
MKKQAVVINHKDNVATVVEDFPSGTIIHFFIGQSEHSLQLLEDIPLGHKLAICAIQVGQDILKYAESIGVATELIRPGQHVHVHNLESRRGRRDK